MKEKNIYSKKYMYPTYYSINDYIDFITPNKIKISMRNKENLDKYQVCREKDFQNGCKACQEHLDSIGKLLKEKEVIFYN